VSESPDLIMTNARVYTCDSMVAWAEAIAVSDGSITAVGTATEITELATAGTEVVDAGGRMVMPGLVDIHTHIGWGGTQMVWELTVQPDDALDEVLAKVGARARTMPDGEWVIGGILGSPLMDQVAAGGYLDALDAAVEGRPVLLRDDSYHRRWANLKALELMGIDPATPDPPDGTIGRDRDRHLTGVLEESAAALAERVAAASIGDPARRNLVALRAAVEYVNSFGVTAIQDAATLEPWLRAMRDLDDEGALPLWVVASLPARPFFSEGITGEELYAAAPGYRRHQIRPNFVKFFLDGVPMTRTSALLEPYICHGPHEDPADTGPLLWTDEELVAALDRCVAAGFGAKFHATGDRSVRQALDAIEIMRERYGSAPNFHSAHAEFIAPSDLPRFTDLGVVADASPFIWFPTPYDESIVNQVPSSIVDRSWPFRQLVDHGALLAAGSDWPNVPTPNPWIAMEAMITRANPDPRIAGQVNPLGAITLVEAIAAFTSNSARAMGMADTVGAITPGKSADFIVLNHNLFDVATDAIHTTEVLQTYFRGRRVHGSEL
jgi:predicted amidohydrolase YtcJ